MRKFLLLIFGAIPLVGITATPALAEEQIDQGNLSATTWMPAVEAVGQTFVAGVSGELTRVDLQGATNPGRRCQFATATYEVIVRAVTDAEDPQSGEVLTSQLVTMTDDGAFDPVIFDAPAIVVAGQWYAIEVTSVSDDCFGLMASSDGYVPGHLYTAGDPADNGLDLTFLTYVAVPPAAPADAEDCRNGGWRSYAEYKNQGECVSSMTRP